MNWRDVDWAALVYRDDPTGEMIIPILILLIALCTYVAAWHSAKIIVIYACRFICWAIPEKSPKK